MNGARPAVPAARVRLLALALAVVVLAWPWPGVCAAGGDVQDLYDAGDYAGALRVLAARAGGMRPGEEVLWRSRLADSVPQALALLQGVLGAHDFPAVIRARIALETAELEAGRGKPQAAFAALEPLLGREQRDLPGAVHLRAGLALRAADNLQQARERLAFVKPGDPAYPLARYHLGDIALELGDPELALGYFQEQARAGGSEMGVFAEGGVWRAMTAAGRTAEAQQVLERLQTTHPDCLPLLEIRRDIQQQHDALAARTAGATEPPRTAAPAEPSAGEGRYCLQFGAFSDRRLAMSFQLRHQAQVPDLRIDRVQGAQGQYVYKVRAGSYPNPAVARAEAVRLRETLGLDVFVTELETGAAAARE